MNLIIAPQKYRLFCNFVSHPLMISVVWNIDNSSANQRGNHHDEHVQGLTKKE